MNDFSKVQKIIIDENSDQQRIDNFLFRYLHSVPKTRIYRLIRKGEVRINKKRVKVEYRLQVGDEVRIPPVHMQEKTTIKIPNAKLGQIIEQSIIHENNGLIIINKPSGIAVHGGSGINLGVIEALRAIRPKQPYLELIHRLDRDTSGCLMIASKRSMLRRVHELLREGKIKKTYVALVKGQWHCVEAVVEGGLRKYELQSGERLVQLSEEGKPSKTIFYPQQIFNNATLVEVALLTGRTHQIRVHAMSEGHQLAGDSKYGDKDFNQQMKTIGLNRLFLHAKHLQFTLPDGEEINVEAQLGADLKKVLVALNEKI